MHLCYIITNLSYCIALLQQYCPSTNMETEVFFIEALRVLVKEHDEQMLSIIEDLKIKPITPQNIMQALQSIIIPSNKFSNAVNDIIKQRIEYIISHKSSSDKGL